MPLFGMWVRPRSAQSRTPASLRSGSLLTLPSVQPRHLGRGPSRQYPVPSRRRRPRRAFSPPTACCGPCERTTRLRPKDRRAGIESAAARNLWRLVQRSPVLRTHDAARRLAQRVTGRPPERYSRRAGCCDVTPSAGRAGSPWHTFSHRRRSADDLETVVDDVETGGHPGGSAAASYSAQARRDRRSSRQRCDRFQAAQRSRA